MTNRWHRCLRAAGCICITQSAQAPAYCDNWTGPGNPAPPGAPPEAPAVIPEEQGFSPNGPNPYYTPTIMAAFRAYKEAKYGGKLPNDLFKLGKGNYSDEPYYTEMAMQFHLFKAGAEWIEGFLINRVNS